MESSRSSQNRKSSSEEDYRVPVRRKLSDEVVKAQMKHESQQAELASALLEKR